MLAPKTSVGKTVQAADPQILVTSRLRHTGSTIMTDAVRSYAGLVPERLDVVLPEKRHRIYKRLRLKAVTNPDGALEMMGALGEDTDFSVSETTSEITLPLLSYNGLVTKPATWSAGNLFKGRGSRRSPDR